MSDIQLFSNGAISLLNASISASATLIELQQGQGYLFPQPSSNEFFLVTLEDISAPQDREIIKIISVAGDNLIVASDGRGYEGTVARQWEANETLVDHRITAETIRQAFLKPTPSNSSSTNLIIKDEGTVVTNQAMSIDFVGAGVTSVTSGNNVIVSIPGSSGGATNYPLTTIEPSWTNIIATINYSDFDRSTKFWVTLMSPTTGFTECFEVLCVVQGLLSANTETVSYTLSNRIGARFVGQLLVRLDKPINQLILEWTNGEPLVTVIATVVSL